MYKGTSMRGARVLITGGGSGIGRQMALEATKRGASVVIWDIDGPAANKVCEEIASLGGAARSFIVDVTDRDSVAVAAEESGDIDVLINNAGIVTGVRLLEATDEQITNTMNVNVLALFWVTRALLPGMIQRNRGTVVTVASAGGLVGVARQSDYGASKFAAIGFNESLRNELRKDGRSVGTLVLCPYYIDTGMFEGTTTKFPRLLPILKEERVARRTIDAIERGQEQLMMPRLVRVLPALRILPTRVFDKIMDIFGINNTMDNFTGRR